VKKPPKEGHKKHDFRDDEEKHSVSKARLHRKGVMSFKGRLSHHISPPNKHHIEDQKKAKGESDIPATITMHIHYPPNCGHKSSQGCK
jgi:hypothetical protein